MLRALKRTYPEGHLAYLVEPPAAPVVTGNPHLDEVIVAPQATGAARIVADVQLGRRLRRGRYDLVIDLHGGPRSAWLTWFSGAPQRIGYEITGRTWMYTRAVPRPRALRPRHSVRNQWDLLEAIDGWPAAEPDPSRDSVETSGTCWKRSMAGRRQNRIRRGIRSKWHRTRGRRRGSPDDWTDSGSPRLMSSSSFTSARGIRSGAGPSRRSPGWFQRSPLNRRAAGSCWARALRTGTPQTASPKRRNGRWVPQAGACLISGSSTWRS